MFCCIFKTLQLCFAVEQNLQGATFNFSFCRRIHLEEDTLISGRGSNPSIPPLDSPMSSAISLTFVLDVHVRFFVCFLFHHYFFSNCDILLPTAASNMHLLLPRNIQRVQIVYSMIFLIFHIHVLFYLNIAVVVLQAITQTVMHY